MSFSGNKLDYWFREKGVFKRNGNLSELALLSEYKEVIKIISWQLVLGMVSSLLQTHWIDVARL